MIKFVKSPQTNSIKKSILTTIQKYYQNLGHVIRSIDIILNSEPRTIFTK